jgi:hypothetical protein
MSLGNARNQVSLMGILSLPRLTRLQDERKDYAGLIRVRSVFYEGSKIENKLANPFFRLPETAKPVSNQQPICEQQTYV